jgi:tetratricopeptide (TPR) repeat protein
MVQETKNRLMNIRNLIALLALVAFSIGANAQSKYGPTPEDSVTCLEQLSLLQEFMKQNDYEAAYRSWKKAFAICPSASKNIYIYGPQIFQDRITKAKDDEPRVQVLTDSLYMVYDSRIEHFGKKCYVLGRKGMDMMRYSSADVEGYYSTLKTSVEECGVKSEAYVLSSYYSAIYNMYQSEKVEKDLLLTEYVVVMAYVDQNLAKYSGGDAKTEKKRSYYEAAQEKINEVFFKVAECPEIENIMDKLIAASPDDMELKKSALQIFDKQGCTESEVYLDVAGKVHDVEPTHESAYALGMIYAKKKSFSKALDYMKQALDLCVDCPEKGKYLEKAGQIASASGSHGAARGYANQMLQLDPNNSEAYVLIGNAIAASASGCEKPQNWGVNWLAYDYYSKAGATSRMNSCAARFPSKSDAFFYQLSEGQTFKVECNGLNESTTVRTK